MVKIKIKMPVSTSNSPSSAAPTPTQNTSTPSQRSSLPSNTPRSQNSRSASPVAPPVSPITPTLPPARLASNSNVNASVDLGPSAQNGTMGPESQSSNQLRQISVAGKNIALMNNNRTTEDTLSQAIQNHPATQALAHSARERYTHMNQAPQVSMPQPKPQTIDYEHNPDVLAMKSTISILQLQAKNAQRDMVTLQKIKERAMEDPEGFVENLKGEKEKEKVAPRGRRRELVDPKRGEEGLPMEIESSSDEDEDENEDTEMSGTSQANGVLAPAADAPWEKLPTPQNIVRCPPVNWAKYGVMGESLDRLHEDQVRRPSQGKSATIKADGTTSHVFGDGEKKEYVAQKPVGLGEVVAKPSKRKRSGK